MKKLIRYIIFGINLVVAAGLAGSYIAVYIPPDKFWFASFFGLAYPLLVIANLFFVVFWIFFKPRYLLVSLVVLLAGWSYMARYIRASGRTSEEKGVKVLSYNIKHFEQNGDRNTKATADSVVAFIKQEAPDIVCLQEVRLRINRIFDLTQVVKDFKFIKHYQFARTGYSGGIVTMTRFPIVNMGEIRFENSGNMAIFTDIAIGNDTVRVINVHLQSFQLDPANYSAIESPDFLEEANIRQFRVMGSKFRRAFKMRAEQARIINDNIEWSPYPVMVCGDFNDTPVSYTYHEVKGDLLDAFIESGKGIGKTYIGKLPSFRIDYILHDEIFEAYNFKTPKIRFSDHLPVTCTLVRK